MVKDDEVAFSCFIYFIWLRHGIFTFASSIPLGNLCKVKSMNDKHAQVLCSAIFLQMIVHKFLSLSSSYIDVIFISIFAIFWNCVAWFSGFVGGRNHDSLVVGLPIGKLPVEKLLRTAKFTHHLLTTTKFLCWAAKGSWHKAFYWITCILSIHYLKSDSIQWVHNLQKPNVNTPMRCGPMKVMVKWLTSLNQGTQVIWVAGLLKLGFEDVLNEELSKRKLQLSPALRLFHLRVVSPNNSSLSS